jgi:hypothetical protein
MGRALLLTSIACCLALCGCQDLSGDRNWEISEAPVPPGAAAVIAGDMADRLSEQLPTADQTLVLQDDRSDYGAALQASLKGSGYAVVTGTNGDGNATALSYTLDRSDEGVLASLSTQRLRLARAYAVSGAGTTPASPLSVMAVK